MSDHVRRALTIAGAGGLLVTLAGGGMIWGSSFYVKAGMALLAVSAGAAIAVVVRVWLGVLDEWVCVGRVNQEVWDEAGRGWMVRHSDMYLPWARRPFVAFRLPFGRAVCVYGMSDAKWFGLGQTHHDIMFSTVCEMAREAGLVDDGETITGWSQGARGVKWLLFNGTAFYFDGVCFYRTNGELSDFEWEHRYPTTADRLPLRIAPVAP